jgi:hypothetical protein
MHRPEFLRFRALKFRRSSEHLDKSKAAMNCTPCAMAAASFK